MKEEEDEGRTLSTRTAWKWVAGEAVPLDESHSG